MVATGFKLTVKATNNTGGEDEETYVVIVMGDTNCDGLNDSGDAVKIKSKWLIVWDNGSYVSNFTQDLTQ